MNILNIINKLNTIDIIIISIITFIFIFLIFLSSTLLKKNKQLRKELASTTLFKEEENQEELIVKEKINNIIKEDQLDEEKEKHYEEDTISIEQEEEINEILKDIPETAESGPYTKNVLKNLYASGQTSPVNIGKNSVDVPKIKVTSYVKQTEKKETTNQEFIENISKRMEEELQPQTIELTDYEKRQEEEAIISYQELLKVKDKLYKITDDEEIDTFIDELKEFRTDLEE